MAELIFLVVLFIAFLAIINLILFLRIGKKRNERIITDLNFVINTITTSTSSLEQNANSRENSMRSLFSKIENLISRNGQKVESLITQTARNNDSKINIIGDRLSSEIQSSTNVIQAAIQHSHSGLSKSFKSKLNEIATELTELHQNLREIKDEILRTQAQSFNGLETRISALHKEEHKFIEHKLEYISKEQTNASKCVQEVTKNINNHFTSIKPLEELLGRLNTLYNKLISLDKDILNQEKSLNGMVEKHTKILEYTQDLQKTSEDIFDMMKLMLMESVVKQTNSNK